MVDSEKTEFNSNVATLERIDRALRRAIDARMNDNYEQWLCEIATLLLESGVKMSKEKAEELFVKYEKFERNICAVTRSKGKVSKFNTRIDNDLLKFEFDIRKFMNDKGMLLSDRADGMSRFRGID